jgi:hypothetical protein
MMKVAKCMKDDFTFCKNNGSQSSHPKVEVFKLKVGLKGLRKESGTSSPIKVESF